MSGDIVDLIDQLVDESLAAGPVDDYNANRYDKCWHCGRDWHGMPITERIEDMRLRHVFDEDYRVDADESRVLCRGSEFIGPMPAESRLGMTAGRPMLPSWLWGDSPNWADWFGGLPVVERPSLERWWRTQLPDNAEIEERRSSHYLEVNTTTLTVGEDSLTWPTENVVITRDGGEEVVAFQSLEPLHTLPCRLTIDVLTEVAPTIGGTWEPLTAPGATRHPDHGPLRRTGPNPWDYTFNPQDGDRVSFQMGDQLVTGVVSDVRHPRPNVTEYTVQQHPSRGFEADYFAFDEARQLDGGDQ